MEYMFVDANYPEYNVWLNFLNDELAHGFQLDALKSSHPIEVYKFLNSLDNCIFLFF